jgi:hypothetical protein
LSLLLLRVLLLRYLRIFLLLLYDLKIPKTCDVIEPQYLLPIDVDMEGLEIIRSRFNYLEPLYVLIREWKMSTWLDVLTI